MIQDITDGKFGLFTAIEPTGEFVRGSAVWLVRCECGSLRKKPAGELKRPRTFSCGCKKGDKQLQTRGSHGASRRGITSPEYRAWQDMRQRCLNFNNVRYEQYGARGITVCDRWLHSFENFLEDMGERPSNKHSIDRIDNDGNYEPDNCRWATSKEQGRNRSTNVIITYNNISRTIVEWSEITGLSFAAIKGRFKNKWSVEDIITKPKNFKHTTKQEI